LFWDTTLGTAVSNLNSEPFLFQLSYGQFLSPWGLFGTPLSLLSAWPATSLMVFPSANRIIV
jgi:hypothetical protein